MVRALQLGRKSQTRRGITAHNSVIERFTGHTKAQTWDMLDFSRARVNTDMKFRVPFKPGVTVLNVAIEVAPRIKPGDVIWWRETWRCHGGREYEYMQHQASVRYRADDELTDVVSAVQGDWRPSLFMPRWAARYTVKVISVRAERLSDITASDAVAEGCYAYKEGDQTYYVNHLSPPATGRCSDPITAYGLLWASINGPESLADDPWVWVVEFQPWEGDQF
jgi:hypothetical protein